LSWTAPVSFSTYMSVARGEAGVRLFESLGAWCPHEADSPLEPHHRHTFPVSAPGPATHVRLAIYPDGGIARLRVFGTLAD
jgi:allantoicase